MHISLGLNSLPGTCATRGLDIKTYLALAYVIYQADVYANDTVMGYYCLTENDCPLMPHRCDLKNVMYQADVYANDTVMSYYGLTENEFKSRCIKNKSSFRDKNRNQTSLSS